MNCYMDLSIQPDEEVPVYFIRNKVYNKLHKVLYDMDSNDVGVSFPNSKKKLGDVIRLHSSQHVFKKLQSNNWLGGLSGYCKTSDVLLVPEKIQGYRAVSRIQQNLSNSKLNRLVKRGSISDSNIREYKAKMIAEGLKHPYLELQSTSTHKKYRIYIKMGKLQSESVQGEFNYFGLSKTATVPWF